MPVAWHPCSFWRLYHHGFISICTERPGSIVCQWSGSKTTVVHFQNQPIDHLLHRSSSMLQK